MFGFLKGDGRTYRQLYAGCCAFQHRRYGLESLPLLSFEGVFLYLLAVDSGACDRPDPRAVTCCRLRRSGRRLHRVDEQIASYCASFGLLLASIKLEDDVRDDGSLVARFALWRLASRIERAEACLSGSSSNLRDEIRDCIDRHLRLERSGRHLTLEEYASPTAEGFALLFGSFARRLPPDRADERTLRNIGRCVGGAVIAFDCAVDWERDRRRGSYNPLRDRGEVGEALSRSQQELSAAGWRCVDAFGGGSLAAAAILETFDRITPRVEREASGRGGPPRHARFRRALRRGDCDCACDPSCCECAGDCGLEFCCTSCNPWDCCWWSDGGPRSQQAKAAAADVSKDSDPQTSIGATGRALAPLNPSGIVLIDGRRVPARAESGWIDADTPVRVVREEPFGVVVRPQP